MFNLGVHVFIVAYRNTVNFYADLISCNAAELISSRRVFKK